MDLFFRLPLQGAGQISSLYLQGEKQIYLSHYTVKVKGDTDETEN